MTDIILKGINQIKKLDSYSENRTSIICFITNNRNKIISTGFNSYNKTHPFQAKLSSKAFKKGVVENDEQIFLHAEIAALIKCRQKPHSMYIIRIDRNGELANCKPCPICQIAIHNAGIKTKNVYYTDRGLNEFKNLYKTLHTASN